MDVLLVEQYLLLTLANVAVGLWITFRLLRNRIKTVAFAWASEFKNDFLAEIEENPEFLERIFIPIVSKLAKKYGIPEPGAPGTKGGGVTNIFGIKIPTFLVEMGAQKLLGGAKKGVEEAAEQVVNPFG